MKNPTGAWFVFLPHLILIDLFSTIRAPSMTRPEEIAALIAVLSASRFTRTNSSGRMFSAFSSSSTLFVVPIDTVSIAPLTFPPMASTAGSKSALIRSDLFSRERRRSFRRSASTLSAAISALSSRTYRPVFSIFSAASPSIWSRLLVPRISPVSSSISISSSSLRRAVFRQ